MGEVQCLDCSRSCARQQILAKLLRATRASKFWIKFWKIRVWAKADMALLLAQVPRAASANRALVVAEHERRLDHVGERRHLCVTEYQLEQREDTLGSRRVGSERAAGGTSRRRNEPPTARPRWAVHTSQSESEGNLSKICLSNAKFA